MYPVLFQIGPFVLYTYGVALTVAALAATFLIWRRARRLGYNEENLIDMVLFSLFLALVFARIFYVLSHQSLFQGDFLKMLVVTYFPGLDGVGGLVGGLVAFFIFCYLKKWQILPLLDSVTKALSLGVCILMVGTFFAGSYVGTRSDLPWAIYLPGLVDKRHPVALYYALYTFLLYSIIVFVDRKKRQDGVLTSLFFALFGLALVVFEWYTEGALQIGTVRIGQIIGLLLVVLSVVIYTKKHKEIIFNRER